MRIDRTAVLSAAVVAALFHSSAAFADVKFWDGPANNLWNNTANWFNGEPGAVDTAVFDGAGSVQRSLVILGADRTVQTMEVQAVPGPGEYKFVSEGGVLTTGHLDVQTNAGSITFEGFKMNTQSMTVQTGATLNLTTNNAQVNASHMFINGALNWTGGGLTTSNPSGINVDGGVMTVTAGGRGLANGTSLHVFNGGTFTSNEYFDVGSSFDAGNGPTGTLSVSGADRSSCRPPASARLWGYNAGDHANVNISDNGFADLGGGVNIAANQGSADVLLQTGGELRVGVGVTVGVTSGVLQTGAGGRAPGRAGGSSIDGGGGQLAGASGGFANINISGGTFSTTANTPATFGLGAAVNLSSGGLNLGGDTTFQTSSTLNYSGGTMAIASGKTLTFDGGVGSITAGGRALSDGATLRIVNGGRLDTTEFFDIGSSLDSGVATSGTLLVSGNGSRFSQISGFDSAWGYAGGDVFTGTFSDHSAGTFSGGLGLGFNGGTASLHLLSSATLNVGAFLGISTGGGASTLTVNGGSLAVSGGGSLGGSAVVNYMAGGIKFNDELSTNGNAQVLLTSGGNKVLRVGGLSMADTSKIDLNDNDMIVGSISTSKSQVETFVRNARNGGDWNGASGITSTAAKNASPKNKTLGVLSRRRVHQRRRERPVLRSTVRRHRYAREVHLVRRYRLQRRGQLRRLQPNRRRLQSRSHRLA